MTICGDRGPDYGPGGVPECGLSPGHDDDHVGNPEDGWAPHVRWSTAVRTGDDGPGPIKRFAWQF
jgi:hypothetical protein